MRLISTSRGSPRRQLHERRRNWREKSGSGEAQQECYSKKSEKGTHGGGVLLRSSSAGRMWRRRSRPGAAGWSSAKASAAAAGGAARAGAGLLAICDVVLPCRPLRPRCVRRLLPLYKPLPMFPIQISHRSTLKVDGEHTWETVGLLLSGDVAFSSGPAGEQEAGASVGVGVEVLGMWRVLDEDSVFVERVGGKEKEQ